MENKKKGWGCWFSSLFLSRAFVFLFPFFSTRVRILGLENYVGDFLKLDRERRPFPPCALRGFDLTRFRVLFISFAGDFWSSCFLVLCSSTGSREAQRWWCLALCLGCARREVGRRPQSCSSQGGSGRGAQHLGAGTPSPQPRQAAAVSSCCTFGRQSGALQQARAPQPKQQRPAAAAAPAAG